MTNLRTFSPLLLTFLTGVISSTKINLCCPSGQIVTEGGCTSFDGDLPPFIAQWTSGEENQPEFRTGSTTKFECSSRDAGKVAIEELYGPVDAAINIDTGALQVAGYDTYSNDEFCALYTSVFTDDGQLTYTYLLCYEEETEVEKEQRKLTGMLYPGAILVSAFFTLITIICYLTVGGLRKTLFSKITLGFLINVFLCYLLLGISYNFQLRDDYQDFLGSISCKILGYIIHHTFIAFFFWMTAMAFNIAKSLSVMKIVRNNKSSLKSFLVNFLYAQGIPTVITILTVLMDLIQPNGILLPNIGEFSCFVGSEYDHQKSFFETSEFIYFYLIVILLITFNVICFLATAFNLSRHWQAMKDIQTSCSEGLVEHFTIILKLSVIMGVPWILDVVSAGLQYSLGSKIFLLRVALDILNLLTGILIFLSLICKPSVWRQIKTSYSGNHQRSSLHLTKSSSSVTSSSFKKDPQTQLNTV